MRDSTAFVRDTEPPRRELFAHCYRMLAGRSSARTWLYQIATRCLPDAPGQARTAGTAIRPLRSRAEPAGTGGSRRSRRLRGSGHARHYHRVGEARRGSPAGRRACYSCATSSLGHQATGACWPPALTGIPQQASVSWHYALTAGERDRAIALGAQAVTPAEVTKIEQQRAAVLGVIYRT